MCYPKPGPRCSGHAGARKLRLKNELLSFNASTLTPDSAFTSREQLQEAYNEAEKEYDLTPAGIKELERRLEQTRANDSDGEPGRQTIEYRDRLEYATAARAARLAALKAAKLPTVETITHDHEVNYPAGYDAFTTEEEQETLVNGPRQDKKLPPEALQALIDDSEAWVSTLTPDETEAVSWYTSNGSSHFNAAILGKRAEASKPIDVERQKKLLPHLESALEKSKRETPLRVFRGLRHAPSQKGDSAEFEAWVAEEFPVGGTYTPKTFASTTLSWRTAQNFTGGRGECILEILTKRGGSVSAVGAWGSSESEVILPRGVEYEVVARRNFTKTGTYPNGDTYETPVTVIQLSEK